MTLSLPTASCPAAIRLRVCAILLDIRDLCGNRHSYEISARSVRRLDSDPHTDCTTSSASATLIIDCNVWAFHYLLNAVLLSSRPGRCRLMRFVLGTAQQQPEPRLVPVLVIRLQAPSKEWIDYDWAQLNEHTAFTACELDHLQSWLSTLGGGYSALGDSMDQCAEIAGRISTYQFRLALQFGDPPLVARSKLYMALAFIQKRRLRVAKHICRRVYCEALSERDVDQRLVNMCLGIWLKLQWSYSQRSSCWRAAAPPGS